LKLTEAEMKDWRIQPGPLLVQRDSAGPIWVENADGVPIIEVPSGDLAIAQIAAAAPTLLEAADLVQRAWVGDGVDMVTAVDAILLAIAKARGESES
jgi:hypothetical protein